MLVDYLFDKIFVIMVDTKRTKLFDPTHFHTGVIEACMLKPADRQNVQSKVLTSQSRITAIRRTT